MVVSGEFIYIDHKGFEESDRFWEVWHQSSIKGPNAIVLTC